MNPFKDRFGPGPRTRGGAFVSYERFAAGKTSAQGGFPSPAYFDQIGGRRLSAAGTQKEGHPSGCPSFWSWKRDSNTRPADYESAALPTELFQQLFRFTQLHNRLNIAYFLMTVKHLFLSPRFTRFADNSLYFCSLPCRFSVQRCIPHPHIFQNPSKKHPVFFRWPSTIL